MDPPTHLLYSPIPEGRPRTAKKEVSRIQQLAYVLTLVERVR
jgi:hypothetical protein